MVIQASNFCSIDHYAHFFRCDEAEAALEQWVRLKVTIIKNKTLCSMHEVQGPVTKDLAEVQQHLRGCSAACCVHAPLCP